MRLHCALLLTAICCSACSLVGDKRDEIARATLYGPPPVPAQRSVQNARSWGDHDAAMSAALTSKFAGFSDVHVVAYAEALGGKCAKNRDGDTYCDIPEYWTFCVSTSLSLLTLSREGRVLSVSAAHQIRAC
jgi:hypothetical protein